MEAGYRAHTCRDGSAGRPAIASSHGWAWIVMWGPTGAEVGAAEHGAHRLACLGKHWSGPGSTATRHRAGLWRSQGQSWNRRPGCGRSSPVTPQAACTT
jgi:hypothetical protein